MAQLQLPPDLVRQGVRQELLAGGKALLHGLYQGQLADSGGEGVDGHNPACLQPLPLPLHDGVCHGAFPSRRLRPAEKDVGFPRVEVVLPVSLVEEGDVQSPRLVHRPELYQLQALADAVQSGRSGGQGLHTGVLPVNQVLDFLIGPPVVVGPGEIGDQVPESPDAQLLQSFGPLLPDALDVADVSGQIRHGGPPLLFAPAATAGARNPSPPGREFPAAGRMRW